MEIMADESVVRYFLSIDFRILNNFGKIGRIRLYLRENKPTGSFLIRNIYEKGE